MVDLQASRIGDEAREVIMIVFLFLYGLALVLVFGFGLLVALGFSLLRVRRYVRS